MRERFHPSAAVRDSQSVKGADSLGRDKPERTNGRKRFIITDALGLLIAVMVRPAGVQDRCGAATLPLGLYLAGGCRVVFADQGFSGWPVAWARAVLGIWVHFIGKPADQQGFQVPPSGGWPSGRWPG